MANLLQKASIVLTPTAYDNGKVLCAKPSEAPYGDFDFSRNSAATRVNAQGLVENVQILSSNLVQNGDFSEEGSEEVSNGSFSQEGAELVTNGSFDTDSDWTKNGTANISGGTGNLTANSTTSNYFTQIINTTIGKYYLYTYEVTANSLIGGANNSRLYDSSNGLVFDDSIGVHSFYYEASATNIRIRLKSTTSSGSISIDNVSVRKVGQDWNLGTGWSIGEDKLNFTNVNGSSNQSSVFVIGKTYKITCDYVFTSGTRLILPYDGSNFNSDMVITTPSSAIGYTYYYTPLGGSASFMYSDGNGNGSITNISVKEVGQNWELGSFTSIGNNVANIINSTGELSLQQGLGIVQKTIKVTYTISGYVSGVLRVQYGNINGVNRSANGTYTDYITGVAANDNLNFYSLTSDTTASITNISVIEITDDTNLPRINYEGFSYQDALGSEEIVNGTFSSDTAWNTSSTGISISGGKLSRDATATSNIIQISSAITPSVPYEITFEIVDYTSGTLKPRFGYNGTGGTSVSGVGTYTQIITKVDQNVIELYGNSFIGSIDNVSVKEVLGQEVVPDSGCGSWLFEPQSTNLITQSELFSDSSWAKIGTSVTSGFSSPSGNLTAFKLVENSANSIHQINVGTPANGDDYSFSVFVKKGEREFVSLVFSDLIRYLSQYTFDLTNGVITKSYSRSGVTSTFTSIYMGNGWYKLTLSSNYLSWGTNVFPRLFIENTATPPTVPSNTYQGDGTSGLYIWGAMLEQNSFSTSYIPTEGSQVTRNQDVCTNGGSLASINSTEGVLYAEISTLNGDSGSNRTISLSDSTNGNQIRFYFPINIEGQIKIRVDVGGSTIYIFDYNIATSETPIKLAFRYSPNGMDFYGNGSLVSSSALAPSFTNNLNSLQFRRGDGQFGEDFFGKTKALAVWKEALSDAELADLTYPTPTDPTFALDFDTIATDFTFARGSEATYVDAQGLIKSTNEIGPELVTNGDFSDGSTDWTLGTGATISNNLLNFDNVNNDETRQLNVFSTPSLGTYEVSFDISNYVGGHIDLFLGGYQRFDFNANGNGTWSQTCVISNPSSNNIFYFVGDNFTGSIDNVSVKEVITATNTPRLDYSTGAEAFLLEPQSTNTVTYSEDFSQSFWTKQASVTLDKGYLAPDGTYNATKISGVIGSSYVVSQGGILSSSSTKSIWAKTTSGTGVIHLGANQNQSNASFTVTNEWQRFEVTGTTTDVYAVDFRNASTTLSEVLVWGAQGENQSYATSYIPTSGTTVTRNQETCINATPEINSEEGVLYAEISALADDLTNRYITISDGTANNRLSVFFTTASNKVIFSLYVGGVLQSYISNSSTDITQINKIACKWKENDFALWVNGVEVATDTNGITFPVNTLDRLDLSYTITNLFNFFGNTKDLQVYPKALSDAELIKLTTI